MTDPAAKAPAPTADGAAKPRPEKPDEDKYKAELAKAEAEHSAAQQKLVAIKAKIDSARNRDKDSPTAVRQQELRSQLAGIRQQQAGFKSSRGNVQERIAALDAQLKSRQVEQKNARNKVAFKNVEEIDREIQRLETQVDKGTMKLVDEKKALAEISSLRKQRKGFSAFDDAQKGIDDVKAQISDLRKGLDNPEAKALSEKYNAIAQELDGIKSTQDGAFKQLNSLRDERTKLQADQQAKYSALKELKDAYYESRRAYRDHEQELYRQRQERQRHEREAYAKEKRRKIAEQKLEEASQPAYVDEILTAEGLIRYFDPTAPVATKSLRAPSGFAAEAQRTVDSSQIKGTVLSKKEDREDIYFQGTGGKKGRKKGGASPAPPSGEGKFNISIGVIEELSKVKVDAPSRQDDIPAVVEKLKAKVTQWKAEQEQKTKENIAKAQAEIDRLEAEAAEADSSEFKPQRARNAAKKPSRKNDGIDVEPSAAAELKQEDDAAADAAEDLKKASLEDKADAEAT